MMRIRSSLRLLLCALTFLGAPVAAHGQNPDIVAQVIAVHGAGTFGQVRIRRDSHEFTPKFYEPLYPGDQLLVLRPGIVADVEFSGGRREAVDARRSPFTVPAAHSSRWSMLQFQRLLALFPSILSPPRTIQGGETLPAPWRGGAVRFSDLLPGVAQSLPPSRRPLTIPVVWSGGPAAVKMFDSYGSVVAQKSPSLPGFSLLYVPVLDRGEYLIRITPTTSATSDLVIPVLVDGTPDLDGPEDPDQLVGAVNALKGDQRGRLKALVCLQQNSDRDFFAYAAIRAISQGANP